MAWTFSLSDSYALMDPAEFISLALRLSTSHREADLRTAVSRAYYGAFHLVRELLEDCGVSPD